MAVLLDQYQALFFVSISPLEKLYLWKEYSSRSNVPCTYSVDFLCVFYLLICHASEVLSTWGLSAVIISVPLYFLSRL